MSQRVAILGGGVGGLTAAHELVERGFEVVLFERNDLLGGKSRSNTKPRTGVNGLKDLPGEHGFRFFPGEAGLELGTGKGSVPKRLGRANFDLGIIAGTRSINLILSSLSRGPNDGKVSVDRTRVEGMRDHLEMPVTHPFMMRNPGVIEQVIHYLEHGSFKRDVGAD